MADIGSVIVKIQAALAEAQAVAAPPPVDVQQDTPVPNFDWLEGQPATLNVLSHFSSPSGKTLSMAPAGPVALPAGVTVSGGNLAYDGTGSFRTLTDIALNVTAA